MRQLFRNNCGKTVAFPLAKPGHGGYNDKSASIRRMEYAEEIPSGMVEAGEDPKVAAHRELLEETGYRVDIEGIKYLGKFQANPAFMSNCMHYFYVNLNEVQFSQGKPKLDPHEKIEVYWVDKREFYENYFIAQDSVFKAGMFLLMQKNGLM